MTRKEKAAAIVAAFGVIMDEANASGKQADAVVLHGVFTDVKALSVTRRTRLFDLITQSWCEA